LGPFATSLVIPPGGDRRVGALEQRLRLLRAGAGGVVGHEAGEVSARLLERFQVVAVGVEQQRGAA